MEGEGLLARAFAMNSIIWTENCMLNWQEDGLHEVSYDEEDQDDAQGGEEDHIYGNTRFFGRNTGSA